MRGLAGKALIGLAAVAVLLAVAPAGASSAAPGAATGITLVQDEVLTADGRLHELTLRSEALGRRTKIRLLLPAAYDDPAEAATRYPMLLLLHGAGSSERSWTEATDIEGQTAPLDLVVVMPEGGDTGFYTDWLDGPQWTTYHLGELVPWIDATYRTVGARSGRAIAGLSMGGFGSASYAARYPDRFLAMAELSGAVDIASAGIPEETALKALGYGDDRRWGPYVTHEANWRGHNPPDLAANLRGMSLRLTTGTGVPCVGDRGPDYTEAGVAAMHVGFTLALERELVPYDLVHRTCGTHEWHYWERDLGDWLPTLMGLFATPPPPPAAFDFRTTQAATSVWGWTFTAHRPATEFLDLRAVSAAGLTATGSGALDVVTPPIYDPGATYAVDATRAGRLTVPLAVAPPLGTLPPGEATSTSAVADADGRLRFTVDLGPAHTADQYSVEGIAAELAGAGTYFQTATVTIRQTEAAPAAPEATVADPAAPVRPVRTIPATGAPAPSWAVVALLVAAAAGLRRLAAT